MVRAIDLQQSILQTSSTEKIQQIQQQHSDMQQRYIQLHLSEEDRLARERVNHFKEADKAKIRKKEEKQDRQKGEGQHPPRRAENSADEKNESPEEGGLINITV